VRSEADLIRVCQIDTAVWEIVEYRCSASQVMNVPRAVGQSKDWSRPDTTPVITQLFHVSAKLRRKVEMIGAREEVAALLEHASLKAPARKPAPHAVSVNRRLLEIAIPDLHIGKLAWAPETGHGSYDIKIARQVFDDALHALVARTKGFGPFVKVLFPIGNDLLHADTLTGTTTKGTQLETDSRFQKSFTVARELMCEAIDVLRAIAPVHAVIVPGNHDQLSAWTLGHSLQCYFHNTPDVTVDNRPTLRKYVQFDRNLLLLTHGDKGKREKYPLLMAREEPELWGATSNHEVHLGHLHQERVQEFEGVKVRIIPSLSAADAWHSANGFISGRGAVAFVWDGEEGIIAHAHYSIARQRGEQKEAA
jgi:hypothetical protein